MNCIDIYILMISNSAKYSSFSKRQSPKVPVMICSQRAKKVLSYSPGLVDFAIGLVNSVLTLPHGQVKINFLEN